MLRDDGAKAFAHLQENKVYAEHATLQKESASTAFRKEWVWLYKT